MKKLLHLKAVLRRARAFIANGTFAQAIKCHEELMGTFYPRQRGHQNLPGSVVVRRLSVSAIHSNFSIDYLYYWYEITMKQR